MRIRITPGTLAHTIYGCETIDEEYFCNYEVDPGYRATLERSDLRISGLDEAGAIRIVESPRHRFYFATLFQPQRSSRAEAPNPVVAAFVTAAREFHEERAARGVWP